MDLQVSAVFAIIWALTVGISVPIDVCNQNFLNRYASERGVDSNLHAFYIVQLSLAMGALLLAVPSFRSREVWRPPTRWWSWMGGICSLLGFITVSATPLLGVQLMLTVQLLGILMTFFVLDILEGTVRWSDWHKHFGFATVVLGVAIDNLSALEGTQRISSSWIFHFLGTLFSGIGYALQAKCNKALAQDVGGSARAAMVSAAVSFIAGVPIAVYLTYDRDVPLTLDAHLWPFWILAGSQSAFYILSMATLPKCLGFTFSYLAILCSKLSFSALADELALSGTRVPLSVNRVLSLLLVIVGAYAFNACGRQGSFAVDDDSSKSTALLDKVHLMTETSAEVRNSAKIVLLAKC